MDPVENKTNDGESVKKFVTVEDVNAMLAKTTRSTIDSLSTKIDSKIDASIDVLNNAISKTMLENNNLKQNDQDEVESFIEELEPKERKVLERVASKIAEKKIQKFEEKIDQKLSEFENRAAEKAVGVISSNNKKSEIRDNLVLQFPDILKDDSALHQKSSEYISQIPKDKRNDIVYQEWAIRKAAADLDIVPLKFKNPSVVNGSYAVGMSGGDDDGVAKKTKYSDEDLTSIAKSRGFDPKSFISNYRKLEKGKK